MTISFSTHVSRSLRRFLFIVPVAFATGAAAVVGAGSLLAQRENSKSFIAAISSHVALLIETNDRPELQRLMVSISTETGQEIEVIDNSRVIASTRARTDIGLEDRPKENGISFASRAFIDQVRIVRNGGAPTNSFVRIYLPMNSILGFGALVFAATFVISAFAVWFLANRIVKRAQMAMEPVQELIVAIQNLTLSEPIKMNKLGVTEFEEIRSTLVEAKSELRVATTRLADSMAKELAGEAYRRLIHDLHNPVTALRQMMRLTVNPALSPEEVREVREKMVELAEQVLEQVKAGKNTLGLKPSFIAGADLVKSLALASERAELGLSATHSFKLIRRLPSTPYILDHDPVLIERVLTNLIANAVEASARRIEISLSEESGMTSIRVSDDGPGLPGDVVNLHLLGRGRSTKSNREGLGLSGCNHIIRSHGGRIVHRKSKLGGLEFELRLRESVIGAIK